MTAAAPSAEMRLRDHPAFVLFWISRVSSALAFQMLGVVVGWLVYSLTGSAAALGLVGLAQFLPILCLTLLVGHAADTFDRRRIVLACQTLSALTVGALALAEGSGHAGLLPIYAAVITIGASRAFEAPTMAALLPRLVPGEVLPRALAVASSAMQMATIAGPAVGGFAYVFGPAVPLTLAAACYAVAAGSMAFIRHVHAPGPRSAMTLETLLSGLAFIRRSPVVLGSISLDLFAVLLGGVTALLPIYAGEILHVGTQGLGALRAAPAVGAVLMSLVLVRRPPTRRVGHIMFAAVAVFGLATVVFALSSSFLLSLGALFVLGAADNVSVVIRSSLVQLSTPDEMRGRVSAVNSLFVGTSNQLGEFESCMVAALIGAVGAGVVGGVGTLMVVALWTRLFPALFHVDAMPVKVETRR
ncbi:MFS transporter [Xanthobacter flavus]